MPTPSNIDPKQYRAGDTSLSARDLYERGVELKRLGKLGVTGGTLRSNGAGVHVTIPAGVEVIYATITGHGIGENDNAHSWKHIRGDAAGTSGWEDETTFLSGDALATPMHNPAYDTNEDIVPVGTNVIIWPDRAYISGGKVVTRWRFVVGGAAAISGYQSQRIVGVNAFESFATASVTVPPGGIPPPDPLSYVDIPGVSITVDVKVASVAFAFGLFDFLSITPGIIEGAITVNDELRPTRCVFEGVPTDMALTMHYLWLVPLAVGTHVFLLKARNASAPISGVANVRAANTSLKLLVADLTEINCVDVVCDIVDEDGICYKLRKALRGRFEVSDDLCGVSCN